MEASQQTETNEQPTAEDVAKATDVSQTAAAAGVDAKLSGKTDAEVRRAVDEAFEKRAKEVHLTMSPEDRTAIVDEFIERLDGMGAFAPPPGAETETPAPTPEAQAEKAAETEAATPPPRKQTWAERHFGEH